MTISGTIFMWIAFLIGWVNAYTLIIGVSLMMTGMLTIIPVTNLLSMPSLLMIIAFLSILAFAVVYKKFDDKLSLW